MKDGRSSSQTKEAVQDQQRSTIERLALCEESSMRKNRTHRVWTRDLTCAKRLQVEWKLFISQLLSVIIHFGDLAQHIKCNNSWRRSCTIPQLLHILKCNNWWRRSCTRPQLLHICEAIIRENWFRSCSLSRRWRVPRNWREQWEQQDQPLFGSEQECAFCLVPVPSSDARACSRRTYRTF